MKITKIASKRQTRKLRVAGYCRVSTKLEAQVDSLENQVKLFTNMIRSNPEWESAGIFADDGISGRGVKKREQFLRMVDDALAGKIDMILCNSVSRFTRNMHDGQEYIRKLKGKQVVIYFISENLRTDRPTDYSNVLQRINLAENSSRVKSKRIQNGIHRRYERGEFHVGNNRVYGYDQVGDKLVPNENAWVVREMFRLFVEGKGYVEISKKLEEMGATALRSDKPIGPDTISLMLKNEVFVGDRILQKSAPINFETKKPDETKEYKQHYLEGTHEGIIDRETWEKACAIFAEKERFREKGCKTGTRTHFMFGRVFCGDCGAPYVRVTISPAKGEKFKQWVCKERRKGKGGNGCKCRNVNEVVLMEEIRKALDWEELEEERFCQRVEKIVVNDDGVGVTEK